MLTYVAITAMSGGLSLALCAAVLWLFPKLGLMDHPERYGHVRAPVPYSAGIIFLVVLAVIFAVFLPDDHRVLALLGASVLVAAVSFADDRIGVHPVVRLCVQGLVAVALFLSGFQVATLTHPVTGGTLLLTLIPVTLQVGGHLFTFSLLSLVMTVAWIVVFMNTLNWLDGVPGMVSGVSTVAFATVFVLSITLSLRSAATPNEVYNAHLVAQLALAGTIMTGVFFAFDLPTPRMLMGDTGTMVLGLLIACLAIYAGSKVATTFLVLGFPIMDALFVVARRLWQGVSPFRGDLGHFHHRLQRIGFTERQTVWVMGGICAFFGTTALLIGSIGKVALVSILVVLSILIEWWVWRNEHTFTKEEEDICKKT